MIGLWGALCPSVAEIRYEYNIQNKVTQYLVLGTYLY